jgi:Spy/CpxP family protein refolding chaperone
MRTIKLAVLLFAVLVLSTTLMAQQLQMPQPPAKSQTPTKMDRAEMRAAMLKDRLKLTDAQTLQVKAILTEAQKQAEADRAKNAGKREDAQKAAIERRQATDEKIKAVLIDDQKKQYDQLKNDQRDRQRPRGPVKPNEMKKPPIKEGK